MTDVAGSSPKAEPSDILGFGLESYQRTTLSAIPKISFGGVMGRALITDAVPRKKTEGNALFESMSLITRCCYLLTET